MDLKALHKSAELLRAARKLAPERLEVHQQLARVLPLVSEQEEARQEFIWLSDYFRGQEDLVTAREQLQNWLNIQQGDLEVLIQIAELHQLAGDKPKAIDALTQAAEGHLQQGRQAEAVQVLERALEIDPAQTELRRKVIQLHEETGQRRNVLQERFSLTETLFAQGRMEEARTECRRLQSAVKNSPESTQRLAELALRLEEQGLAYSLYLEMAHQAARQDNLETAKTAAEKAHTLEPDEPAPHQLLIDLLLKHNDTAGATEQLHQLANLYRRKNQVRKLTVLLRRILNITPDDTQAREELIECLLRQGNMDSATEERIQLAEIFRKEGKSEEALHQYHRILEKNPFNLQIITETANLQKQFGQPEAAVQFYLDQAKTLDRLGAKPEAEQLLQQALKLAPDRVELIEAQTDLYRRMERIGPALAGIEKLVAIYLDLDQIDEAIRQIRIGVQISPQNVDLYQKLAELYVKQGQTSRAAECHITASRQMIAQGQRTKARTLLEQACENLPEETGPVLALIRLLEEESQPEEAAQLRCQLAERLMQGKEYSSAIEQLTLALPNIEEPASVINTLAELHEMTNDSAGQVVWLRKLADEYQKQLDRPQVVATLERVLRLQPDDLETLRGLADARLAVGETQEAALLYFRLARIHHAEGRLNDALEHYRRCLKHDPEQEEPRQKFIAALRESGAREEAARELVQLARILSKQNKTRQALEALQQSTELQPDNPRLRQEYADALLAADEPEQALEQYLELVNVYIDHHLAEKAAEVLGKVKNQWPDNMDVRRRLVDFYLKENSQRAAVDELMAIATHLIERGEDEPARENLEQVLEIAPDELAARISMAEVLGRLVQPDLAAVEWLRVAKIREASGELDEALDALDKTKALPEQYQEEKDQLEKLIENRLRRSALDQRRKQVDRLLEEDKQPEAFQVYETLLEDYPDNVDIMLDFARLKKRCGQTDESLTLFLEAADRFRTQGHLRRTIQALQEILEQWPESEPALQRMVEIEESAGRQDEAAKHYLTIATIKERIGRLDLAISLCEKILTLDRNNTEARSRLGRLLSILGRTQEAYQHLLALGDLLREKDRIKEATEAYEKAAGLMPEDGRSFKKLAELLTHEGRIEEAVEYTLKAAEIDWNSGHRQEARRQLTTILQQHPDMIAARKLAIDFADQSEETQEALEHRKALAVIYQRKQQPKRAIGLLREIIEALPKDISIRRTLAQLLEQEALGEEAALELIAIGDLYDERGISGKAISFYRQAQKHLADPVAVQEKIATTYFKENLNDKGVSELMTLALWLQENDREEDAINAYQQALDADPGNLRVLNKMASCFEEAHRPDQAAGVYRQIVDTYVERGILGKAIEVCSRAIEVASHDTALREKYADLLIKKGSLPEAKKQLETLLQYSPGDIRLSMRIEKISRQIAGKPEKTPQKRPSTPTASGMSAYDPFVGSLEPPASEPHHNRGQEGLDLFKHKRYSRAIDELTSAINLWKQHPTESEPFAEYFTALGICYLEIQKPAAAVEILMQGIGHLGGRDEAQMMEMRYQLARAYEAQGDSQEAVKLWKAIYAIDRSYKDVANKILWARIGSKKSGS